MLFILSLVVRVLARPLVRPGGPGTGEATKDLEILILRQQLQVLRRTVGRPKFTPLDRVLLVAGATQVDLPQHAPAGPAAARRRGGRAGAGMAGENPRWGCVRICGELRKLGIGVGATTIRTLLRRHGLGPAPRRGGPTWAQFLKA